MGHIQPNSVRGAVTLACGTWAKKWANGARNAICKETYFYFYLQAKRLSAVTAGSSHMNGITFL
jgi:hypothetical protein